ncbi:MAG: methyl coenzyme M reductase system, component A2 [Candidatus Helarchaeota archaeon]
MSENEDWFLKVEGLSKEFVRGEPAFNDVNFILKEGHSFGILGKSGCGKSALMHAIRGTKDYQPTRGKVFYRLSVCPKCKSVEYPSKAGEDCPLCSEKRELQLIDYWETREKNPDLFFSIYDRIAIMLQRTFALFGEHPVLLNIRNTLEKYNYPKRKIDGRSIMLLSKVKLTHRAMHLARDLSGGEKQRAAFATCLAKSPLLFLADEPTGTLDPLTAEYVHDVMKKAVRDENLTLVVTSHWPHAVAALSEEAILLERGKVIKQGDPNDVSQAFMDMLEEVPIERRQIDNPIIKIDDARKYYWTFDRGIIKACDGVELIINEGEIFGLLGVSGSGKTSLAHMIIGLRNITSGNITVRVGEDWVSMNSPGPHERGRATKYMAILHQEYCLYPHRTVLENITGAVRHRIPEEIKTNKAYDALRAVNFTNEEIDNILYQFPDNISEGERHRVAMARILIQEPKIVLLDEPTGTADPLTRMEIVRSIKKSRDELEQTYLIISHDIDFIEAVCDRAALMKAGRILKVGDPSDVIEVMRKEEAKQAI